MKQWISKNWRPAIIALAFFVITRPAFERLHDYAFPADPEEWFTAVITVPSFVEGDEDKTKVTYDREILADFVGKYWVEVVRVNDDGTEDEICEGSDQRRYSVTKRSNLPLTIVEYVGPTPLSRPCAYHPGRYYFRTTWKMTADDGEVRSLTRVSNQFYVTPR